MASRVFRAFFFLVDTGHSTLAFHDMLLRIQGMSPADRAIDVFDSPVQLVGLNLRDRTNGLISGDLERLQMDNFPSRSKKGHRGRDLQLDEDEGLGHSTAFLYDARSKILVFQGNITGVGITRFKHYIQSLLPAHARDLDFSVVMRPDDSLHTAMRHDVDFRKVTFSVTDPMTVADTLSHLHDDTPIASAMLNAVSSHDSRVKMTVTLSVGRSKTVLDKNIFIRMINNLRKASDDGASIDHLVAKGVVDGENVELNFLQGKLVFSVTMETIRGSVPFSSRLSALHRAASENASVLREMFTRDESLTI